IFSSFFFFSSRRRHTRSKRDWSSDVCSSDLDLVTMFNISVDEYFYPAENVVKSTARRQIETSLDLLSDNELKIIQGTIDGILNKIGRASCREEWRYRW